LNEGTVGGSSRVTLAACRAKLSDAQRGIPYSDVVACELRKGSTCSGASLSRSYAVRRPGRSRHARSTREKRADWLPHWPAGDDLNE